MAKGDMGAAVEGTKVSFQNLRAAAERSAELLKEANKVIRVTECKAPRGETILAGTIEDKNFTELLHKTVEDHNFTELLHKTVEDLSIPDAIVGVSPDGEPGKSWVEAGRRVFQRSCESMIGAPDVALSTMTLSKPAEKVLTTTQIYENMKALNRKFPPEPSPYLKNSGFEYRHKQQSTVPVAHSFPLNITQQAYNELRQRFPHVAIGKRPVLYREEREMLDLDLDGFSAIRKQVPVGVRRILEFEDGSEVDVDTGRVLGGGMAYITWPWPSPYFNDRYDDMSQVCGFYSCTASMPQQPPGRSMGIMKISVHVIKAELTEDRIKVPEGSALMKVDVESNNPEFRLFMAHPEFDPHHTTEIDRQSDVWYRIIGNDGVNNMAGWTYVETFSNPDSGDFHLWFKQGTVSCVARV